jgi:hypothetical protein
MINEKKIDKLVGEIFEHMSQRLPDREALLYYFIGRKAEIEEMLNSLNNDDGFFVTEAKRMLKLELSEVGDVARIITLIEKVYPPDYMNLAKIRDISFDKGVNFALSKHESGWLMRNRILPKQGVKSNKKGIYLNGYHNGRSLFAPNSELVHLLRASLIRDMSVCGGKVVEKD